MNIANYDLNLLVHLDVLLREASVTRAAQQMKITQPAMSNSLKRLRKMFADPLLVRTSTGMVLTERALQLRPQIRQLVMQLEQTITPSSHFEASASKRRFRIMCSDYAASTLLPALLEQISTQAKGVSLDIMTPSDVSFHDVEAGKVDVAINMFEQLPLSFHQKLLWQDNYVCVCRSQHPFARTPLLENYLANDHVWVSKTGYGVGVGIDEQALVQLSWVDRWLAEQQLQRSIKVFTRNYHMALTLVHSQGLIATVPSLALTTSDNLELKALPPPFPIPPLQLKMLWSPLLQHDAAHIWLRRLISDCAQQVVAQLERR